MEHSIYERIKQFCETKNISQNKFCELCGISSAAYSMAKKRKSELGHITIVNILTTFEELSPDWFLLQKGQMFRDKLEITAEQSIIKELLDRNEKLIEENAILKYQLNNKK